jgi:hypothetical protein
MQADMDDMPDYLRAKKKNPWRMVAIVGIGSAITISAMALFTQPIEIDLAQLKAAVRIGGKPIFEQAPQAIMQQPEVPINQQFESVQPKSITRWDQANPPQVQSTSDRQTVFNDRNYTPKGAANVVNFTEVPAQNEPEPAKTAGMVTIVEDSNAKKDYCWMHRNGSIEKRECKRETDLYLRNK